MKGWDHGPERVCAKRDDVVGTVAGLVRHESIVALVCLDDGWGFEVVFVETVDDRVYFGERIVEGADVDVTAFDTIAVGVQSVGRVVFVVGENAKVLRPVS
jgi:hypothetical protein